VTARRGSVVAISRMLEQRRRRNSAAYDLRHTAATQALKKGLPVQNVSKVLGHSNPGMTLKRYAHVLDDMCQEAARAMDDLF